MTFGHLDFCTVYPWSCCKAYTTLPHCPVSISSRTPFFRVQFGLIIQNLNSSHFVPLLDGITCEAIEEASRSSKAIDERQTCCNCTFLRQKWHNCAFLRQKCINMANILEFLSKDGNITPEKARKSRQMQFRDKTAYVWGLSYRWDPSLSMSPVRWLVHFMHPACYWGLAVF